MNKVTYFIGVLMLFFVVSCSDSAKKNDAGSMTKRELYRAALTQQDSLTAQKTVTDFMEFVQNEKYADAVMMLHKLDEKEPYSAPELLDNEEIAKVTEMLKQFPVESYQIQSMEFESAVNNTILCRVNTSVSDSKPSLTVTWAFNPINYLGEWKLCFASR